MTNSEPNMPESPMTDQEIDSLIRDVFLSTASELEPESPSGGHLTALWYLAVFLLGMTVTEGLRVLIPPLQEVRGHTAHRCGGVELPNPAEMEAVAWTPE